MRIFILLAAVLLAMPGVVSAGCLFGWNPVTTDTAGNPITDLAGYRLYLTDGATGTPVVDIAAPATAHQLTTCAVGERYYLTAFNTSGAESGPSNTVEVVNNVPPLAPAGFGVQWSP